LNHNKKQEILKNSDTYLAINDSYIPSAAIPGAVDSPTRRSPRDLWLSGHIKHSNRSPPGFPTVAPSRASVILAFGSDAAKFDATIAKKNLHIPLLFREKRTDFLFERYAVVTQAASVIVRGAGPKLASKLLTRDASHESN
jgi:hypothetical protein